MKKRLFLFGIVGVLLLGITGCSDPKADAKDTNIRQQMEEGTLDRT